MTSLKKVGKNSSFFINYEKGKNETNDKSNSAGHSNATK